MKRFILILLLVPSICFGASYQAEILVSWIGDGTYSNPHRPDWKSYEITTWRDTTNQSGEKIPSDPNLFVAYIEADNATILKMKDDGIVVLWMKPKGSIKTPPKQTKVQLDTLKADLAAKGVLSADIAKTALGDTSKADVTAVDVSMQLKSVMKEFPAAKVEEVKK
jgi:hypothetical protein